VTRRLSSTVHEERLASALVQSVTDMLSARTLLMKPTAVSDHYLIAVVLHRLLQVVEIEYFFVMYFNYFGNSAQITKYKLLPKMQVKYKVPFNLLHVQHVIVIMLPVHTALMRKGSHKTQRTYRY